MKIIAVNQKSQSGIIGRHFIAEISETEVSKVLAKQRGEVLGKDTTYHLTTGSEFDLGAGPDFVNAIESMTNKFVEANQKFSQNANLFHEFLKMVHQPPSDRTVASTHQDGKMNRANRMAKYFREQLGVSGDHDQAWTTPSGIVALMAGFEALENKE